jgi:prophage regulatory protein
LKIITYERLAADKGIPYSREHIRRLEIAGKFPKRVRLGEGPKARHGWIESELDSHIAEKMAARKPEAA